MAVRLLIASAWVLAALSVADLLDATLDGATLVFGPVVGVALGLLAARQGASRRAWRLAVGVNAAVLIVTVLAIFTYGGT